MLTQYVYAAPDASKTDSSRRTYDDVLDGHFPSKDFLDMDMTSLRAVAISLLGNVAIRAGDVGVSIGYEDYLSMHYTDIDVVVSDRNAITYEE